MVPESVDDRLRVAILSPAAEQRSRLRQVLESNGLEAVEVPDGGAAGGLAGSADVLLVNLDDEDSDAHVDIDAVLDRVAIPILFNDAGAMRRHAPDSIAGKAWGRRLAEKLQSLARGHGAAPPSLALVTGERRPPRDPARPQSGPPAAPAPATVRAPGPREPAAGAASELWVLAASIGGPKALAAFLEQLPADLPVGFVVAQHIGLGFVDLLASQLARVTPLPVRCGEQDMVIGPGQIAVAPVEQRFGFSEPGRIQLAPEQRKSIYSPCIDDVMFAVAEAYGPRSGAVIFSGMGSDGVAGGRAIAAAGGTVFAQEPGSCVVSSMADGAREAGVVRFSGTPEELASRFLERFGGYCDESVGG